MMKLSCSGPIWTGQDWSSCYQKKYIDNALPALAIVLSLLLLLLRRISSARRHANSARKVAQLDPGSSNINLAERPAPTLLERILSTLMPWNGPYIASFLLCRPKRRRRHSVSRRNLNSATIDNSQGKESTPAALAIYHTENAVILNEVHKVLKERLSNPLDPYSKDSESDSRRSPQTTEKMKRIWELAGSSLSAIAAGFGVIYDRQSVLWLVLWIYLIILSSSAIVTTHSYFKHKALLFTIAFLYHLSNLRSTILLQEEKKRIIADGIQLALSFITVIPTAFFPYQTNLPLRLRAIQRTMNAQEAYGETRTAIPTPRVHLSPTPSINGDVEQAVRRREKGKVELIPFPQNRASIYSRALFSFVTPFLFKHYRDQFTLEAVPDLPPGSHAASVVAAFRSSGDSATGKSPQEAGTNIADEDEEVENGDGNQAHLSGSNFESAKSPDRLRPSIRSLSLRLIVHFLPLIIYQMFWAVIQGLTALMPAVFLKLILGYIAERSNDRHVTPLHMAITYAIGLAFGQVINSISASQALWIGRTLCIRLRAILLFEIINKALRRRDTGGSGVDKDGKEAEEGSDAQKNKRTSDGELNNLVAIDVFRVSEIGAYLHFLFPDAPIEIGLCVYLLINLLGKSALAGLAVLVLSLPLQTLTARLFVKVQKKLLKATDERLNLTNEVLNCIKTVKFFAWEKPFEKRLDEARAKELRVLALRCVAWLLSTAVYLGLPMMVTVVTFAVHTRILQRPLPAETAFTALALFNALRNPIDQIPDMFVNVLTARVSLGRIDKFLAEEETTKYEQLLGSSKSALNTNKIGFINATFTYSEDDEQLAEGNAFCLKDITVNFPIGHLSVIAGPVGSGKTTMLMSLLGETRQLSGQTFMPCVVARALVDKDIRTGLSDTVAYCSQSPWLLGATVKENILFGQDYEDSRYRAVIKACALEADLKILEYHDETEVGEKGTSLSGGQKARVALARALYSPAKTLLIDDALSAVDVHTAKHLYRHYLKGPLMKDRTVILVTHATHLCLPGAAFAVAMNEGQIVASGSPKELLAGGHFEQDAPASGAQTPIKPGASQLTALDQEEEAEPTIEELDEGARAAEQAEVKKRQDKKALFANEETYGKGSVGFESYKLFLTSFAASPFRLFLFWTLAVSLFSSSRGIDVVNAAWLRQWAGTYDRLEHIKVSTYILAVPRSIRFILSATSASLMSNGITKAEGSMIVASNSDEQQRQTTYYLTIYGLLVVAYVFLALSRDAMGLFGSIQASRRIYRRLMYTIIQAKPQWFDRTPIGRIMNRLSKDVETLDQDLAPQIIFFVDVTLQTIVILLVACYAVPAFTVFAILVVLLYWLIGALYVVSSRDLKRLESVSRSPIFTLVGEVLSGAVIIRAYGDASRFTRHCLRLIDKTNRPFYFLWAENRWLSLRVDVLASIVSLGMSLFLILTKSVDAALAGFALSFTIQLVNAVLWVLRMYTMIEINANSIERVGEYLQVESESRDGIAVPAAWPSKSGSIQVENLVVRYSPELPQVLKGISFNVQPGEKVGIVGRTGSGKSSLALAFFRFLEAESGKIVVDGLDISSIKIEDLRSRLTVIPQEAQLFSGTIRSNLDPFGICEDDVLWDALQRCQLASKSQGLAIAASSSPSLSSGTATPTATETTAVVTSLDMVVEQGGKNFSAGQKQLLALARGLLKISNSNIVILDESTASLDQASEEKIQRTIQSEMKYATMLTIAHRLRGIIAFDKVLVMDAGEIIEFDRPSTLMKTEGSAFKELCVRSEEFETLLQIAEEADEQRQKLKKGLASQ